jgi:DNA helicase-2/ATP-dependent DNA helicase PcrA
LLEGLEALVEHACPEARRDAALERALGLASMLPPTPPGLASWGPMVLALAKALEEADGLDDRAEAVSVLTLHASKGLEFQVVFIVGCEEGLLPLEFGPPKAEEDEAARTRIEEERRLLYVGMTRARRLLLLTLAKRRPGRGRTGPSRPSRFLALLPERLVEELRPAPSGARSRSQLGLFKA